MLKIILPIIIFISLIYAIVYQWEKANSKNKKKLAIAIATIIFATLLMTIYFIID